ncbi:MAG: DUF3179 domain-containing protein [Anaerolinea sp.]|nr:DUF3179 domain-containing protein [Anaerolinea sp.]
MLKAPMFDVSRAVLEDYLAGMPIPPRIDVTDSAALGYALVSGMIAPDALLLTFEIDGTLYALPMQVVLASNVVQGSAEHAWVLTFCNACNTGMVFDARVNGQTLHFQRRGSYDGLLIIWDQETGSYWQHITGECLHGASVGSQLTQIASTREMRAAQASKHKNAVLLTSALTPEQVKQSAFADRMRSNPGRQEPFISATMASHDERRPRFELGLGVWEVGKDHDTSTFFPLVFLHTQDNVHFNEFNRRRLLVYLAPDAVAPVAAYVDATRAWWEGETLRLNGGNSIQNDMLLLADGSSQPLERPRQLLMRWYGFAVTFPGCALPRL